MTSIRVFFVGGLLSYRSLFDWMSPWILIPTLVIQPIFQVLLFAYIGRGAGVGTDEFYVMGNALSFAAIPCLFAMGSTIEGERWTQTLGLVLATPARRIPLFLGRSLPVIVNGWAVALVGVLAGVVFLHTHIPGPSWPLLLLTLAIASASCTGLGLAMGALALRVRQGAVIGNVVFCLLLVFSGVNVAPDQMPAWMAHVGAWLPLTHGIEATRDIANGAHLDAVTGLLGDELGIGALYAVIGLALLHLLELQSRRSASLERT